MLCYLHEKTGSSYWGGGAQVGYRSRIPKSKRTLGQRRNNIPEKTSMNEGTPCPADEERGEVHLEVGAGADQQQHHRHKRVEVEQRRLHPPTTPPPLSGMEEEGT